MRLFLITRNDNTDWDEYNAVLVRAEDVFDAARLVLDGENPYPGLYENNIVITPVRVSGPRGQIIADFNAG
ncbi:hypothetical protein RKD49_005400 [Streptomyces glaucescens]|jgi:hypothetical protein